MAIKETRGLMKFVLFTMDGQGQNRINNNFVTLKLYHLHPEIATMLTNFTMSEITNYFIEVVAEDGETSNHHGNHLIDYSKQATYRILREC